MRWLLLVIPTWGWAMSPAPVKTVVEHIPLPEIPPPVKQEPLFCDKSVELIVSFEVGSPGYYNARLLSPIWPGGASGVTIGVGYDIGHQTKSVVQFDWQEHQQVEVLPVAVSVTGPPAKTLASTLAHVRTPYPLAESVFQGTVLPRYWQATQRAFPGVEKLNPCPRGVLLSLVYNRGSAMAGSSRAEMRVIRDECVPLRDYECIEKQILKMRRLWVGTKIESGMSRRREAEAQLLFE